MLDKTTHNSLVKTRICLDLAFFSQKSGIKIVFLESCTGGLVSSWITTLNGSSSWFEGGIVAYSNQMKILFLDVHKDELYKELINLQA